MAKQPPGNGKHKVKKGEWVASIAAQYGYYEWEKVVWDHEKNAELRENRRDPQVLKEGDELFIPPWEEKEVGRGTGQTHPFRLKRSDGIVRVQLLNEDGSPRADEEYSITFDHDDNASVYRQQSHKTDAEGMIIERVPHSVRKATLTMVETDEKMEFTFGHLSPLHTDDRAARVKGVQQRLAALGFDPGEVNGEENDATKAAVRAFMEARSDNDGSSADGEISDDVLIALEKAYGC